jgi:3-oxoadipate enol-lactonase
MARVPSESYRAALCAIVTFDARALLSRIAVPTLVIAGSHDSNAPAPMMERMAGRIARARFALCEGAGHLAPLERPDAFNRAVEAFIQETETKAEP